MFLVLMKCLGVLGSCYDEEITMSGNRKLVHCLLADHLPEKSTSLAHENIPRGKIENVVRPTSTGVINGSTKAAGRARITGGSSGHGGRDTSPCGRWGGGGCRYDDFRNGRGGAAAGGTKNRGAD